MSSSKNPWARNFLEQPDFGIVEQSGQNQTQQQGQRLRQSLAEKDREIEELANRLRSGEVTGRTAGAMADALRIKREERADIQNAINAGREIKTTLGDVGREVINAPFRGAVGTTLGGAAGVADYLGFDDTADSVRSYRDETLAKYGPPEAASQNWMLRYGGMGGEAVGSTIPFLAGGIASVPVRAAVGGMAFGTGVDEQDARVKQAREQGVVVSREDEVIAETFGGLIGLSELLPVKGLLARVPQGYGQRVVQKVGERFAGTSVGRALAQGGRTATGKIAGNAIEEGLQEAVAGVAQDLVELGVYNENATVGESALQDFALGAFAGGVISGGRVAYGRLRGEGGQEQAPPSTGSQDTDLLGALEVYRQQGGQRLLESPETITLRDLAADDTPIRAGGLNLTPAQLYEFAENNTANPRIAEIMAQPASPTEKASQVARVLNAAEADRVEARAVEQVSGLVGPTQSVTSSKQMIGNLLDGIGPEVVAESQTLTAIRNLVDQPQKGQRFVNGIRDIVGNYAPTTGEGESFVARPERGADGSVIMGQAQVAEEAQREREADQAFRLSQLRQERFDRATGTTRQREDLRAGAPEPETQFFLGENYGDLAGTPVEIVQAASPDTVRLQYESPTETDASGRPVTISEEVSIFDVAARVIRGTNRMTQDLAANLRAPKAGVGTDMDPRRSVDRTRTRAVSTTEEAGLPAIQPNLVNEGYRARPTTDIAPQSAQETPAQENIPLPQGVESTPDQAPDQAQQLPAPPQGLPAPARALPPTNVPEQEGTTPEVQDQEASVPEREAVDEEIDIDNDPRMVELNDRFDAAIERVQETENTGEARKLAKALIKEGVIDEDAYIDIDEAIKDETDRYFKHDTAMMAIEDAIETQRDNAAADLESEILDEMDAGDTRFSGRTSKRKKRVRPTGAARTAEQTTEQTADQTTARERPAARQEPVKSELAKAEQIINDRLDKIAGDGEQGARIAQRLRELLDDRLITVPQLYAAFEGGKIASQILPKNANVDVVWVPILRAGSERAAVASGTAAGQEAAGSYEVFDVSQDGLSGIIRLSLSDNVSDFAQENAAHEAFHVIQDMLEFYDPAAFNLINSSFRDGGRVDDFPASILRKLKTLTVDGNQSVYQSLKASFGDNTFSFYEAQAVAFGALVDAKNRGENMKGLPASFIRIVDFAATLFRDMGKALRLVGDSPAEIFDTFRTGQAQVNLTQAAPTALGLDWSRFYASLEERYSARTKPDPIRTQKAYKLFRVKKRGQGQLFPLFVKANEPVPIGQWLDADVGDSAGKTKTGKAQVKSSIGPLALRAGWHAGDLPIATHIGGKRASRLDPESGKVKQLPTVRRANEVWAEVELAADRDWQSEADRRAERDARGNIIPSTAQITDQIPEDGFYRYKTNPNMTGNWLISGAMKVNRILSDEEVAKINEAAGVSDLPREAPFDAAEYGLDTETRYSGRVPKNPAVTSSLEHNFGVLQGRSFNTGRDFKEFIQARVKSSLEQAEIDAENYGSDETFKYLTKMTVKDAEYALQENANAIGWYDEKVSKALAVLSLVHPEIATDRQSKFAFVWALAVTSNGLKVNPNFELAEKAYRTYKETGQMPTKIGIGTAADAIDGHMKLFNKLMGRLGFDELERLMTSRASVKAIEAETGIKISGEAKSETVFGAAILGPKIGNGFFANLYGHFDQLTMDRWLMRTWGRWTGSLISVKQQNVEKGRDVLSKLLAAITPAERKELGSIIGVDVDKSDIDAVAMAIQKASIKPANRTKISDIGRGRTEGLTDIVGKAKGRFKQIGYGDEIRKKGNGLTGYLDGQKEAPAGANERKYIRSVFQKSLATLQRKHPKLTMADLQALLWYPEKRLYEAAKTDEVSEGYDDDSAPDYANAAILVAKNAGVSDEAIKQAAVEVDARLRSNVGAAGAGRSGAGSTERYSGRTASPAQIADRIRSRFPSTPRVEGGPAREGNVGRRRGGVLADDLTGRVPVKSTYSHSEGVKAAYAELGVATPDFHELTGGRASAALYSRLINEAKVDNRFGASVYVYPTEEYTDMRLFLSSDGTAGFALKGDDIVSAFKAGNSPHRAVAYSMVRIGVALGGRRLDAFDTVLPSIYSASNFRVASRMRWNDEYAPDDWSKETFAAFNNGEPDVVFMAYDENREGVYEPDEGEYADDYDTAVAMQTAAVSGQRLSGRTGGLTRREMMRGGLATAASIVAAPTVAKTPITAGSKLDGHIRGGRINQALLWISQNSTVDTHRAAANILRRTNFKDVGVKVLDFNRNPDQAMADMNASGVSNKDIYEAMNGDILGYVTLLNPDDKNVYLIESAGGVNEATFLHEVIHDYVKARWNSLSIYTSNLPQNIRILQSDGLVNKDDLNAIDNFYNLWREFRDFAGAEYDAGVAIAPPVIEAVNSPNEAISYFLTSPTTQAYLKRLYRDDDGNLAITDEGSLPERSWLDEFFDFIRDILGIAKKDSSVFDEYLNAGLGVLREGVDAQPDYEVTRAVTAANRPRLSGRTRNNAGIDQSIIDKVTSEEPKAGVFGKFLDKMVGRVGNESRRRALVRNVVNDKDGTFVLDKVLDAAIRGVDREDGRVPVDGSSVGRMMEMASQTTGVLQMALELGPPVFDGENTSVSEDIGGLFDIFEPIGENRAKAFQTYAVARRERDLRSRGRVGFTELTDSEIAETLRNADADFEEVFAAYQEFNGAIIDYAVDTGLLTQELGDTLKGMDYVPYYRAYEQDDGELDVLGPKMQAAMNNPKSGLDLKLKGGSSNLGNLYENIIRNTQSIIAASRKNLALQEAADAVDALNELGVDDIGRRVAKPDGEGIMRLRVDGKPVYYKIEDPAVWAAIASLGPQQMNIIVKAFSKFANVLRTGVTLAPSFMIANLWRGKISTYVTTDANLSLGIDTLKGMKDAYKNGATTQMIKANTGIGGYTYGMGERDFANEIRRRYRRTEVGSHGFTREWLDRFKGALVAAERVGEATELAERVKLYEDIIASGGSPKTAAYEAMNLTNFGRKGAGKGYIGATLNVLVPMIPFLNARIQGLYRIAENQRNEATILGLRKKVLLRGMLYTMASSAIYAMFSDDDRWEEETVENKMLYDIMYVGDKTIYLPRPFEVGTVFGSLPVTLFDHVRDQDGDQAAKRVAFAFTNTFAMNPIPQGVKPALEASVNYSFFRGGPIDSMADQGLPAGMRYDERTSEIAKSVGGAAGVSPKKVDYVLSGYLGTMGAGFIAGVDAVLSGVGAIPKKSGGMFGDPYHIGDTIASASGITRFVRDSDRTTSRFVRDFYELKREADQANRARKKLIEEGRNEEALEFAEEMKFPLQARKQLGRIARDISKVNKQIDLIEVDPKLAPAEKQLKLKPLLRKRKALARSGYDYARGMRTPVPENDYEVETEE